MQTDNDFYELKYPFVLPDFNIVDAVCENSKELTALRNGLTPLEHAFVSWWYVEDSPSIAIQRMIHPAHPFLMRLTITELSRRPTVVDFRKKFRKLGPLQQYYDRERVLYCLHRELDKVSPDRREHRYRQVPEQTMISLGKMSLFAAEQSDADRYLKILEMIVKVAHGSTEDIGEVSTAGAGSGDANGSVNRVLAQAEQLILGGKATPVGATETGDK